MFRAGGFGDEVAGGLLVVEIEAVHRAEEAGVGFIVEGDGDLAGDVVEGLEAEEGVAGHAAAGDFGAQVGEASGELARGFPGGRGFEGIADVAACGAEPDASCWGGVLLVGGIMEDGANGLGHCEDVLVAVVGDGGGGGDVQAEAASPSVGAASGVGSCGKEADVTPVTGGEEIARALVAVAAFGSALGAAVGTGAGRNRSWFYAVGGTLTGATFIALFAARLDAVENEIVAAAVVAFGASSVGQDFGFGRKRRNKAAMAGGAAVGLGAGAGQSAANGAFPAADTGRGWWRGEGGHSVGGAPAVFAAVTLASFVNSGVYKGFALAVGAGHGFVAVFAVAVHSVCLLVTLISRSSPLTRVPTLSSLPLPSSNPLECTPFTGQWVKVNPA